MDNGSGSAEDLEIFLFSFFCAKKCNLWEDDLDWGLIRNFAIIPCYNN